MLYNNYESDSVLTSFTVNDNEVVDSCKLTSMFDFGVSQNGASIEVSWKNIDTNGAIIDILDNGVLVPGGKAINTQDVSEISFDLLSILNFFLVSACVRTKFDPSALH